MLGHRSENTIDHVAGGLRDHLSDFHLELKSTIKPSLEFSCIPIAWAGMLHHVVVELHRFLNWKADNRDSKELLEIEGH